MKQKIFFAASLLLMMNVSGQQKNKIKFHCIDNVGMLKGATDASFQFQTINGAVYKTVFVGIGAGIEKYYKKTIPVFLDLRKHFGNGKLSPFMYADIGANFPWAKDNWDDSWWQKGEFSKGLYFDAGVGYSVKIFNWTSLLLSLGYSQKQLNEEKYLYPGVDILPYPSPDQYKYTLRRISLKIGLSF